MPPPDDREAYLDALFRELEESPQAAAGRGNAGYVLLGIGLVLGGVGFSLALASPTPEMFLSLALPLNVLAVICAAAGVLLIPESPEPLAVGFWSSATASAPIPAT